MGVLKTMEKYIINDIKIITMNGNREIIEDGAIVVNDGIIEDVGIKDRIIRNYKSYPQLTPDISDGKRFVALPGLIQTHVHTSQNLGRGLADDVDLITWTRKRIWPYEAELTEEDVYISSLLSMAEMIKSGTTTFAEAAGEKPDFIGKAIVKSGMRGLITLSTMDLPGEIPDKLQMNTEQAIKRNVELVEKWHGKNERVSAGFNILNNFLCSEVLWKEFSKLAQQYNTILATHLSESISEVQFIKEKTGTRPINYLNDLGVLGPHIVGAHVVHINDEELNIIKEKDVKVAHCPAAGLRLCGIARIPEMLAEDINVSLGTNSPPCNNRNNMFDEMWIAAMMHKGIEQKPKIVPAHKVLEMATINGAKALGKEDEIGSLEPGKKADLILLDLNKLPTTPTHDLISTLIYQADGSCVDTTIVNGKVILEKGKLTTIDEKGLIKEAEERAQNVVKRANIEIDEVWPVTK